MKEAFIIEENDTLDFIKWIIDHRNVGCFITTHKIFSNILTNMAAAGEIRKKTTNYEEGLNYIYETKVILI